MKDYFWRHNNEAIWRRLLKVKVKARLHAASARGLGAHHRLLASPRHAGPMGHPGFHHLHFQGFSSQQFIDPLQGRMDSRVSCARTVPGWTRTKARGIPAKRAGHALHHGGLVKLMVWTTSMKYHTVNSDHNGIHKKNSTAKNKEEEKRITSQ